MNIAVFIKSTPFHKNFGGLETFNKVLCEGLVTRGHHVTVFSPQKDVTQTTLIDHGIDYVFIPCVIKNIFSEIDKNSWFNKSFQTFKTYHAKNKFDIVLGQSSGALGIIHHKNELGIKIISISHGSILSEYKTAIKQLKNVRDFVKLGLNTQYVLRTYFGSQRDFIRKSNKIIAVSSAVKESVLSETFVNDSKVEVIFNGVDESTFSKYKHQAPEKTSIIYVGRVIRSKGIFNLIDALKGTDFDDVLLNIVGTGEDLGEVKNLVYKYKLENRVKFYGQLPPADVVPALFKNDIFVLPSLRIEGFPMTLVEAMFAGLPIVASNIGGISDAVLQNETGYLVAPGDIEALAHNLQLLIKNKDLREKFGYNAKARANREFTLGKMLDKYERVIKEVLL